VEYRVLSGYFLSNDETIGFMWDQAMKAIDAYNECEPIPNPEEVQDVINNSDVETATMLTKEFYLI